MSKSIMIHQLHGGIIPVVVMQAILPKYYCKEKPIAYLRGTIAQGVENTYCGFDLPQSPLFDLEIGAEIHLDRCEVLTYDMGFRSNRLITLATAKRHFETLSRLNDLIVKMHRNKKEPKTFGEYLQKVTLALDIKRVFLPLPQNADIHDEPFTDDMGILPEIIDWRIQHNAFAWINA